MYKNNKDTFRITLIWPYASPDPGAASSRCSFFTDTLSQKSIVSVISFDNSKSDYKKDPTTRLSRKPSLHPLQIRKSLLEYDNAIAHTAPDMIIASAPSYTSAFFAYRASQKSNVPFVLDLRDAIVINNIIKKGIYHLMLRRMLTKASAIFVTTEMHRQTLLHTYSISDKNIMLLPNGGPTPLSPVSKNVDITYLGSINPERNLKGIQELIVRILKIRPKTTFRFIGADTKQPWVLQFINHFANSAVTTQVEFVEEVTQAEALQLTAQAKIGLLPMEDNTSIDYQMPVKLYEYLAASCAVASLIPEREHSAVYQFVSNNRIGPYSDSPTELAHLITELLDDYAKMKNLQLHNCTLANEYTRTRHETTLLNIINQ